MDAFISYLASHNQKLVIISLSAVFFGLGLASANEIYRASTRFTDVKTIQSVTAAEHTDELTPTITPVTQVINNN